MEAETEKRIYFKLEHAQQIKDLKIALQAISKIGSELMIEGLVDKLILTSVNVNRSACFAVTFYASFFNVYLVTCNKVQSAVLLKHVLATFRTQKISCMTVEVDAERSRIMVTVEGENRIIKTYDLDCLDTEVLNATVDKDAYPTHVIAEASELNKLLGSFQSNLDEITMFANPESHASAASMHRACQLQSFCDPQKSSKNAMLHTSLAIDTRSVFLAYRHRSLEPSDATFNVKDFRSIVTLCEHQGANIILRMDQMGMPVVAETYTQGGVQPDNAYGAELILATLPESQREKATTHHEPQQQLQQQQQQHQGLQEQPEEHRGAPSQGLGQPHHAAAAHTREHRPYALDEDFEGGDAAAAGGNRLMRFNDPRRNLTADMPPGVAAAQRPDEAAGFDADDVEDEHRAGQNGYGAAAAAAAGGRGGGADWDDQEPDPEELPRTGRTPPTRAAFNLNQQLSRVDRLAAAALCVQPPGGYAEAVAGQQQQQQLDGPAAEMAGAGEADAGMQDAVEDDDEVLPSTPDDGDNGVDGGMASLGMIAE